MTKIEKKFMMDGLIIRGKSFVGKLRGLFLMKKKNKPSNQVGLYQLWIK